MIEEGRAVAKNSRSMRAGSVPAPGASSSTKRPTPVGSGRSGKYAVAGHVGAGERFGPTACNGDLRALRDAVMNHFGRKLQTRLARHERGAPQLRACMPSTS